uniref:H15 domain-containing protein n=1 Tax=Oryzias latipes TaxID=8090 RepID=A0A3B3HEL0_ORYLA
AASCKTNMAEVAPAPAAAPVKVAKKRTSRPKKAGPSLSELIVKSVAASKERSGVSAAALKKALAAGGYDVDKNKARVNTVIKGLLTKGTLVHTKGTGAAGSFKVSKTSESTKCCNLIYPPENRGKVLHFVFAYLKNLTISFFVDILF